MASGTERQTYPERPIDSKAFHSYRPSAPAGIGHQNLVLVIKPMIFIKLYIALSLEERYWPLRAHSPLSRVLFLPRPQVP